MLALYVYILVGCGVIANRPLVSLLEKIKSLINNTVGDWNLNILYASLTVGMIEI